MAGLPPDTIQVKRKRGAEDPVDFLRLERSKRYRSLSGDGWIYRRKEDARLARVSETTPSTGPPTIQATQEGEERRPIKRASASRLSRASAPNETTTSPSPKVPPTTATPTTSTTTERVRRFHLTKSASPQPSAGVSKKRTAPAVFIERDAKKQRESLKAVAKRHNVTPTAAPPKPPSDSQPTKEQPAATEQAPAPAPAPAKLKRPGTRALPKPKPAPPPSAAPLPSSTPPTPSTTLPPPNLPPSMQRSRDSSSTPSRQDVDELARQMDSWTLDLIAANEAETAARDARAKYSSPASTKTTTPSRFKPKAPKQRWFERHPEAAAAASVAASATGSAAASATGSAAAGGKGVEGMEGVEGDDTTDEEDYVLETYERVPAGKLLVEAVPAHRVGLLVFDTEPEMVEFFYGNESDEEEEFPEDEDDENAENYYANEYPDEDLDWDDEFDRNPYSYMNQNASDMEEFDERDFSGDKELEETTTDELLVQ